jgi:hypothetical protein
MNLNGLLRGGDRCRCLLTSRKRLQQPLEPAFRARRQVPALAKPSQTVAQLGPLTNEMSQKRKT